ncbi:MAG: BrnT family toxin [Nitrospira sp.]|nr:BrnT family toxin [Nitrospira sp.]
MKLAFSGFEWDEGNRRHCQKHGLSPKEIEHFLQQDNLLVAPDVLHAEQEERYLAVGLASTGKPMLVIFTLRKVDETVRLRPISARYMHEKEARKYEEESAKI